MVFEAAPLSPDGINAPPPHPLASADHLPTSAVSSSGCHLLPLLRISTTWTRISGVRILRLLCPFRLGTWLISVSSAWIIRRITFSRSIILWCHRNIWRLDHAPPQEVCKGICSASIQFSTLFLTIFASMLDFIFLVFTIIHKQSVNVCGFGFCVASVSLSPSYDSWLRVTLFLWKRCYMKPKFDGWEL